MENLAAPLMATAHAVAGFGANAGDFQQLSDPELLGLQRAIREHQRRFDAVKAAVAGQLARRSRPELGHAGLAAREGFRSAADLLQSVAGTTGREAVELITLGKLTDEAQATQQLIDDGITDIGGDPVVVPWEAPIMGALTDGILSADQADALRRGLGKPSEQVTADLLRATAVELISQHGELSADRLFREARTTRDLIDMDGIPAREEQLFQQRSLKISTRRDGMVHAVWDLDPEGGAHLIAAIDPLTSPRRGGPRMVDESEKARAQRIIDDPRSTDQIASDGLLQLVRLGTEADPGVMYGKFRPLVKIIVTKDTLRSGKGAAVIEGNPAPVSADTATRLVCSGDTQELITTEDGGPLDLGRTKRLFNRAQHEALAARDGGCMWPECTCPPSWTEAHHIDQYERDGGKTNIADGICLCKFHHLVLHNNHWEIQRVGNDYWLIPPPMVDSAQTPILLETKSLLIKQLRETGKDSATGQVRASARDLATGGTRASARDLAKGRARASESSQGGQRSHRSRRFQTRE